MTGTRRFLGSWNTIGSRSRVFLTPSAIEVDEYEGWSIERRRVFLDDVVQITRHRRRNWIGFWILLGLSIPILVGGLFGALASQGRTDAWIPVLVCLILSAPFLAGSLLFLRAAIVVSVVGRRTRTQCSFWWSRSRAEAVFQDLCDRAAAAQATHAPEAPAAATAVDAAALETNAPPTQDPARSTTQSAG